jgi:hypothetical protein
MPRGDKGAYSTKQKRQAEHIEEATSARAPRRRKPNDALGRRSTTAGGGKKSGFRAQARLLEACFGEEKASARKRA